MNQIIQKRNLITHFQPIVQLSKGQPYGFEALTRGPIDSPVFSPIALFSYAEKTGHLYGLEKAARELAIERSTPFLKQGEKLFLNISAQVIYDPNFTPGHTIQLLKKYGIEPSDIVFEITERSAIEDFEAFREVIQHYRNQGFLIAVDDAGAGYSSLQAICELTPDYIKIDRSLISSIDTHPMKRHIVEVFTTLASKMDSNIIAEGIETARELSTCMELGIPFAQGYFLGRPSVRKTNLNPALFNSISVDII
ncbi:EAL domain-containing protein [Peribacillus acanthi]|uniref:EAL domain-containing protein n=1 Tax=Peribacillus acanthi TaxID=2171554 RepID=UPI001300AD23|nr:EAL domain-containing protein [Peribacillus acanthi]